MPAEQRRVEAPVITVCLSGSFERYVLRRPSPAKSGPAERDELAVERRVGMPSLRQARRPVSSFCTSAASLCFSSGRSSPMPACQERAGRDAGSRIACLGLARCRSARRLIAEAVGVRVAGQDVAGNVVGQAPCSAFGRRRSRSGRRPSGRRRGSRRAGRSRARQVAGLHGHPRTARLRPRWRPARRRPRAAAASPAAQFQRPGHAVAALGVRVRHAAFDRASTPATGLCQPTAARSVGEGCTATPCGFMLPGMRTCWSDELAIRLGVSGLPQPLTKS